MSFSSMVISLTLILKTSHHHIYYLYYVISFIIITRHKLISYWIFWISSSMLLAVIIGRLIIMKNRYLSKSLLLSSRILSNSCICLLLPSPVISMNSLLFFLFCYFLYMVVHSENLLLRSSSVLHPKLCQLSCVENSHLISIYLS